MSEIPCIQSIDHLLDYAISQLAETSETAALDAEVLLSHCLQKNRSFLRAWPEHLPAEWQISDFMQLLKSRRNGVPVAYLTGKREFWSRDFAVSPAVLIPRPDSELLIELALELLPHGQPRKIIDLGTGSGILALTLAAERPLANVLATNISAPALKVAQQNAAQLQLNNVHFFESSWFDRITHTEFDLVISNPPYISANDPHLQQGDVRFEPEIALVSPVDGLQAIRQIAEQARKYLKPHGWLLIEHGYNQQVAVQNLFQRFKYQKIQTHRDLSGNPRVTSGLRSPL